jgi:predicted amidohydrolase
VRWRLLATTLRAPQQAEAAELELWLRHAPGARAWWAGAALDEVPDRAHRVVTLGTVRATPPAGGTVEANLTLLAHLADEAAGAGADVVCLPETATYHGTGLRSVEAAEPLHGPTAAALGRVAAARRCWIVAQLPERQGHRVYNTAVLIDRAGRIAAHYHKMHLTCGELEAGLVPGEGPVVAETDFGRVGLLVCYDLHFPEAPRLAALAGAEVLCGPTAGDRWPERRDAGNRAHALANGVFLVTSLVQGPSEIIDPDGRVLATAAAPNSVATARVDLDDKDTPEGRSRGIGSALHNGGAYWMCRRADLYDRLTGGAVR